MEIAFPVETNQGIQTRVHDHFGTAKFFMIVESESNETEVVANPDLDHESGACQPLSAFEGKHIDAMAVGGIGGGALHKLRNGGIKVYRAVDGTIHENLELFRSGKLPEFPKEQICTGDCHHH